MKAVAKEEEVGHYAIVVADGCQRVVEILETTIIHTVTFVDNKKSGRCTVTPKDILSYCGSAAEATTYCEPRTPVLSASCGQG
jgi:hypothetical protein